MIKKETLLKKIAGVLEIEERIIPLLDKHVSSSLSFSSLSAEDKEAIPVYLRGKVETQKRHVEMLKEIIGYIKESDDNVY